MARVLDGAIAELAPTTLGLLTTPQLDAAGISRQRRRSLIANGTLVPVGPGVLRHPAHPESWEQRLMAAVLVAGEGAVASHFAAAALWGFAGFDHSAIEVTVPRERRPRKVVGKLHRTIDICPADVGERRGVPCTSPTRTFLDLAPRLDAPALEAVLDAAERDGKLWRPRIRWRIGLMRRERVAGRPGLTLVEELLDRTEGRLLGDSWLEQETLRIVEAAGLPQPRIQVRRRTTGGGVARVDMWWDAAMLVVEVAGHRTHSTRRQRQADDERAARLGLRGWHVVEFTYEDVVERPDHVVEIIRGYLELRA